MSKIQQKLLALWRVPRETWSKNSITMRWLGIFACLLLVFVLVFLRLLFHWRMFSTEWTQPTNIDNQTTWNCSTTNHQNPPILLVYRCHRHPRHRQHWLSTVQYQWPIFPCRRRSCLERFVSAPHFTWVVAWLSNNALVSLVRVL